MIGTIVNVIAIVAGSVIGGMLKRVMSERVSSTLFTAMGVAAMVLGINSAVQNMSNSSYPVLFIASLAIGGAIGSSLRLGERMGNATSRRGGKELGQGLVTGCLLFCVGTLSILGPVQSALYGDATFLFTNAMLDFVTSMVLASTYGVGMCLAAVVLFVWQGSIYALTVLLGDFISRSMMTEFSIVGGCLIMMSGISILGFKEIKTLDFLPALAVPVLWCPIAPLLSHLL